MLTLGEGACFCCWDSRSLWTWHSFAWGVKVKVNVAQSCPALCDSQNAGVGSLSLLQGIFPTQGSNPGLPHCRKILYQLSHKGSPRRMEWVAYPFSSGSSRPRNRTGVSCIADGFLTNWAMREAHRVTWLMAKALRPDCLVQIHFPLACSVTIGSYWPSP